MRARQGGSAKSYRLKRVYAPAAPDDGLRVLVDRLWPRGLTKAEAGVDLWLRDIAPSHALRRQAHGDPDGWEAFTAAYAEELKGEAAQSALGALAQADAAVVTLLFAAKDEARNNAVALLDWLRVR